MNDGTSLSVRWLRGAMGAVAFVVVVEAALGFLGATKAAAPAIGLVVVLVILGAGATAAARRWRGPGPNTGHAATPWTAADGWAALALVVAVASRLGEGLHHAGGTFTYDVLSYHLHLPASWWASGRVGVIPTPFGDQAPAYAPANAELTYLLALAATGNLRLAHAGQAPFAGLAALALVATARQLGVSRRLGCGAALAFLMIPEVWQQATGAMADLALASFVLACLPFVLRLRHRRAPADVIALGTGLGLALGTKYTGAILVLPLLAATAVALARLPAGSPGLSRTTALGLMMLLGLACGGFWYVRNAAMTGDPTFPVTLRLGGLTLGRGLYGGAEMRRWLYHLPVTDLQPLLEMFDDTGWGFLGCLTGGFVLLRGRQRATALGLFVAQIALVWLVLPYQQSRFLFPAWGVGAVTAAAAASGLRRPILRDLALAPAVVGAALQYPTPARLLVAGLWGVAAGLGARAGDSPSKEYRIPDEAAWLGPTALAALGVALAGWTRLHPAPRTAGIGDAHDAGWAYAAQHLKGRQIAYAGSNLPLPLWGWRLENRVRYVNVAGKLTDVLHDFRDALGATGSAEPAPERAAPDRAAWLANLAAAGIDNLFVARLYPEVAPSMPHDSDDFPTERGWADSLPARFHLAFATPELRIYDVHDLSMPGRTWPEEQRP